MIQSVCACGAEIQAPEEQANIIIICPACERLLTPVSAEALADGSADMDFDARLIVEHGPQRVGEQLLLGGSKEITIGKLATCHIRLVGERVSRDHCRLERVDYAPGRWKVVDSGSTNGVKVNGEKLPERELIDGDELKIGEYRLRYQAQPGLEVIEDDPVIDAAELEVLPDASPAILLTPPPLRVAAVAPMPRVASSPALAPAPPLGYATPRAAHIPHFATPRGAAATGGLTLNWTHYTQAGLFVVPLLLIVISALVPALGGPAVILGALSALALILWGGIAVLVIAFTEDIVCGLMYLFVPFYSLYYVLTRWSQTYPYLACWLAGTILMVATGLMAPSGP
jgi:hypothetical protein